MEKRCKRCGEALPQDEIVGASPCPSCGALYGVVPLAKAVVEALEHGQEPEGLPRGLRVEWSSREFGPSPFRSNTARVQADLALEHVQHRRSREWLPMVLSVVLILVTGWLFYRAGFRWWLLVPAALTLRMAHLVLGRLTFLSRLTVDSEHLTYTTRSHASLRAVTKRFPVQDVRQLYVVKSPTELFELRVRLANDTSETLHSMVNPDLPLLYEALAERALGITDEAAEGELDRHVPNPRRLWRRLGVILPAAALTVACAVPVEAYGTLLDPLYLDDGPREASLHFSGPVKLRFGSWLYYSEPKDVSTPFGSVAKLQRATRFDVELLREDQVLHTLSCDPYDLIGLNFTGDTDPYAFFFGGFMRNCAVELPAGSYTLRAKAVDLKPGDASLFKRRLEPRMLRKLW